jgi:hypothetical protein
MPFEGSGPVGPVLLRWADDRPRRAMARLGASAAAPGLGCACRRGHLAGHPRPRLHYLVRRFGGGCLFPNQEANQAGEAIRTLTVGGLIAGVVMAAAPWCRRWLLRMIAGIGTLGITLGAALLCLGYISRWDA